MSDWMDATAQAAAVAAGEVSPGELVDEAIARAEKVNADVNAIIHPLYDKARDQAAGDLPEGPMQGVPVLFKDLSATVEGDPNHNGIQALKDANWVAPVTDDIAQGYLDAGVVCLGRTNTPELGLLPTTQPDAHGASRNPWDTTRTTGGSSGGSAAAVAAGIVSVAHANDGGGSIRIPASANGLVGLKPSRGRVPLGPAVDELVSILPVNLCVSRTVRDTALVLDCLQGNSVGNTTRAPAPLQPYRDAMQQDPGQLRIGFMTTSPLAPVHTEVAAAVADAGRLLEAQGHAVDSGYPEAMDDEALKELFIRLWSVSCAAQVMLWGMTIGRELVVGDVEPLTMALTEDGLATTAVEMTATYAALYGFNRNVDAWFRSGYDLLMTPTLAQPPVSLELFDQDAQNPMGPFDQATDFAPFTASINVTGQPAISLPLGESTDGLPIGVHLVAPYGREDLLLQVAAQLEEAAPWLDRTPPIWAGG